MARGKGLSDPGLFTVGVIVQVGVENKMPWGQIYTLTTVSYSSMCNQSMRRKSKSCLCYIDYVFAVDLKVE